MKNNPKLRRGTYPIPVMLALAFFLFTVSVFAQRVSLTGTYEQDAVELPDGIKESENDLVISQDPTSSKKIWVSNLLEGGRIYALAAARSDEKITYQIPAQTVNGYKINTGWVVYDLEKDELAVSINNAVDNAGKPGKVRVGTNGTVEGGGVKIGKNGSISAPGVDIDRKGVRVDYSKAMGGISYMGHKVGMNKKEDDN